VSPSKDSSPGKHRGPGPLSLPCIVGAISLEFRQNGVIPLLKEILITDREESLAKKADHIRLLKKRNEYGEAEKEIRRELESNPDQPSLKTSLADLYLRQGRIAEGRILAEEVLTRDPQHPQALSVLGDLLLKQRSPQQALDYYRQASLRDSRPYLVLKIARALKEMRQFDEALQELEKVLVVKPENLPLLKEKAVILNRMKRFDQALEVFNRVREIAPEDPFVQKEILRLRSRSRSDTQVLKELKAVVGMDSKKDDAQMHGLLAQKLKGAGLVREAAAEYKVASALEPGNPYFLKQQGFCHYREGSHDEAIHCLTEAFQIDPSDYVVLKTLEKSFEARGKREAFLALLEEVHRQHPDHRPLLGTLRRVRKKLNIEPPKHPD
jgi:tetratricopeptide (TPR) repeat protein